MEFLVTMTTHVPSGTPDSAVDQIRAREAARSRVLVAEGHLLRLWRPPLAPGEWRTLGLFAADDAEALETVLASMPLRVWRTDEVTPLVPHGNDPKPPVRAGGASPEFFTEFTIVDQDAPDESFRVAVVARLDPAQCDRHLDRRERLHRPAARSPLTRRAQGRGAGVIACAGPTPRCCQQPSAVRLR